MKTANVKGPAEISVDETQKPTLNSGDILVQMHACGICGSDLEKVFGQYVNHQCDWVMNLQELL